MSVDITQEVTTVTVTEEPVQVTVTLPSVLGGTSGVTSFNGRVGVVVSTGTDYDADDIAETANNKILTSTERTEIAANTLKTTNATHTGDATGSTALTLATVNANVGSFTVANITVNAKGLITAASSGAGGSEFADNAFKIYDATNTTFKLDFDTGSIGQSVTWTVSDFDIDFNDYFTSTSRIMSPDGVYYFKDFNTFFDKNTTTNMRFRLNSVYLFEYNSSGSVTSNQNFHLKWTNDANSFGTADFGLKRISANLGMFTDGSTGIGQLIHASPYATKTANYTIVATTDRYIKFDSATAVNCTLPTAVGIGGTEIIIKNRGLGLVTMITTSSQTMDDFLSGAVTITTNNWIRLISDNVNWDIIG